MRDLLERIDSALGAMGRTGPRDLIAYLECPGPDFDKALSSDVEEMLTMLLSPDPNNPSRLLFSNMLRSWDNNKDASWTNLTHRNTSSRRKRIHELLKSSTELEGRIDSILPFYHLDEPLIIAEKHHDWYNPKPGIRDYYWKTYCNYLAEKREWDEASILDLNNSTRAIVECLADPESDKAYASRGLVMGYVQSGKTANFAGVVARAADAGYRLIIVLAGTWNILRNQTQRRFDKEMLGKELLKNDDAYQLHPPLDWHQFLEHGTDPVELGHYDWQRLTRPDIDFRRLKAAIGNLEFEKRNKALPLFDPSNLHALHVKFLVVKKHSGILANLVKDLKLIRTRLTDLPALVIDDESDQAGLNTAKPLPSLSEHKERSKTNLRIVELLQLFPRGQYVGYTATPYANALVDPDDPEDLFPRDFIISLDRPRGYMGVSDFFDPTTDFSDLDASDFSQPEIAFIRRVETPHGSDDEDLKQALRSFVLAGGLKLYRQSKDPQKYKAEHFKHHTMLIHTSPLKGEHLSLAGRVEALWNQCAFNSPKGLAELKNLWEKDHLKVCSLHTPQEIVPPQFDKMIPHLSEAITNIEKGYRFVLVVNSDTADAPDFSAAPVWKIIVGGNKLSRGYTIEGLTVSYYRRVTNTADTLMQMGRWFGFRPGYKDLVRVFLGVNEGKRSDTDLVALFKEVCRMEERFRDEIKRYIRRPGSDPITPRQIPPLISISGSIPPTARNKMFNAVLANKNFGRQWSMLTLTPTQEITLDSNIRTLASFLGSASRQSRETLGGALNDSTRVASDCILFEMSNEGVISFLKAYRWLEVEYNYPACPVDVRLQIEFLEKQKHEIVSWLVVAPQRNSSYGQILKLDGVGELTVKERHRVAGGRGFQVFGESHHRKISEYLTGLFDPDPSKTHLGSPNAVTSALYDEHRGIFLLYPVREHKKDKVSIGFELLFPDNKLSFELNFTVVRKSQMAPVVVKTTEFMPRIQEESKADRGLH